MFQLSSQNKKIDLTSLIIDIGKEASKNGKIRSSPEAKPFAAILSSDMEDKKFQQAPNLENVSRQSIQEEQQKNTQQYQM